MHLSQSYISDLESRGMISPGSAKAAVRSVTAQKGMNKTELRWAQELEIQRKANLVAAWWYESLTLRLAENCRYTPDFLVQRPDGSLEIYEIKGAWRKNGKLGYHGFDDSNVKLRVCAERFPFKVFLAFHLRAEGWTVKQIQG